jgi:glycerol-3-phosphate acyltransferase PlsY
MTLVAALLLGYLLGSIPTGYLIGRMKGIDIRTYGSGGTGGTNVLRTLGKGAAIATGLTDFLKGLVAAWIGYRIAGDWGYGVAGLAALTGHSYPVWLGFRGGKAVATSAGALVLFHPMQLLIGLVVGIPLIAWTRWVSLGSIVGATVIVSAVLWTRPHLGHVLLALGALAVILIRHRANMVRIWNGTENRLGEKAKQIKQGEG